MMIENSAAAMTDLCHGFHVLRGKPGTDPWDQHRFARWLQKGGSTATESLAGRFVLEVWNGGYPAEGEPWWELPPFDVVEAFARWDQINQAAFIAWCADPFWP